MKIMVVEDDYILGPSLCNILSGYGFDVTLSTTGKYAESVLYQKYDFIVLDLGLPDMDGIDLLKIIRKNLTIPVLILSAKNNLMDKISGLEYGADDYMTKPFDLEELVSRLKAIYRRSLNYQNIITIGKINFNPINNQIKVDENILLLPFREQKILELLILKKGTIVSKDDIAARLSSNHNELSDNAIEVYIYRLRKRVYILGIDIKTIRGIGYLINDI